jgi:hypothetical protein
MGPVFRNRQGFQLQPEIGGRANEIHFSTLGKALRYINNKRSEEVKESQMAEPGTIYGETMGGETQESFVAADTDMGKWSRDERIAVGEAKEFLGVLKEHYSGDEAKRFDAMLSTQVDDQGHTLGDSRIFVQAVSRAARQVEAMVRKRAGMDQEGDGPKLKFNMPIATSHEQRIALQREARTILDKELMAARSEFIRRSGRSLPGWWR